MREIQIDELKRIQLDIMQAVHDFCISQGIYYSLTYGTLIGAVRHHGYIPWDDDIDICMPRTDYDRFLKLFNQSQQRYKAMAYELDSDYPYTFAKVEDTNTRLIENADIHYDLGINIDIFPIDGADVSGKNLRRQVCYHWLMNFKCISLSADRNGFKNLLLCIGKLILAPISIKYILACMMKNAKSIPYNSTELVACVAFGSKENHPVPKSLFQQQILVPFEDREFYIMNGYREYLTSIFGDYLQLPPVEQQISHHNFTAYCLDDGQK